MKYHSPFRRTCLLLALTFQTFCLEIFCQPSFLAPDYHLVFSDEFTGTLGNHWNAANCTTHGDELQVYRSPNAYVENNAIGQLVLVAKKEVVNSSTCPGLNASYNYSSGEVNLNPYLYGYFEVRAYRPGGCGAWPAIWFWSGLNNTQYSEIDVIEGCGAHCDRYQAGIYEDDTFDGIANSHDIDADHKVIHNVSPSCQGFQTYGVEWRPDSIIFYYNDKRVFGYPNKYTHQPLSLILNLAIGNFDGCLCDCNLSESEFPRYFLIDWVHIYKRQNDIITLKPEKEELCVGQTTNIYAPIYDGAQYTWSTSNENGLKIESQYNSYISASEKPGFQGGWKTAKITALAAGNYTVTLDILFPDGSTQTKSIQIKVASAPPQTPTDVLFSAQGPPKCCYKVSTTAVFSATSYLWTVSSSFGSYDTETTSNYLDDCLDEVNEPITISVRAKNACGVSPAKTVTRTLPRIPNCTNNHWKMASNPNPTTGHAEIKIYDGSSVNMEPISDNLVGDLLIKDYLGNTKKSVHFNSNPFQIDLSDLPNDLYRVIFYNEDTVLNTSLIKSDGN